MNPKPDQLIHPKPSWSATRRFVWYWMPVVGWCTLIFIQSAFPSPEELPSFAFSDKLMHLAVYALLAVLVCRAANSHEKWQRRWWPLFFIGVAVASLYGLSDEWHQSFVAARSAEMADIAADFLGSLLGSGGCLWVLRRRYPD